MNINNETKIIFDWGNAELEDFHPLYLMNLYIKKVNYQSIFI